MYDETDDFEPEYISDDNAWDVYVGDTHPLEFVKGYDTIEDAVEQRLVWLEDVKNANLPSWLYYSLIDHCKTTRVKMILEYLCNAIA